MLPANTDALFEAALKLSDDERLALVSRLLETMPPDDAGISVDDPGFNEELERRGTETAGEVAWSALRAEGRGT